MKFRNEEVIKERESRNGERNTTSRVRFGNGYCENCIHEGCYCLNGYYGGSWKGVSLNQYCEVPARYKRNLIFKSHLPDIDLEEEGYGFDDYAGDTSRKALNRIRDFADRYEYLIGNNYYIFGPNGTQKTTMIKAMGATILRHDADNIEDFNDLSEFVKIRYVKMDEIRDLLTCMESFSVMDNRELYEELSDTYSDYEKADILILDECFDPFKLKTYKTGFNIYLFDKFIRERLESKRRSTFFISNVKIEDIDLERFGASLKDLVERETWGNVLEFNDKFYACKPRKRVVGGI